MECASGAWRIQITVQMQSCQNVLQYVVSSGILVESVKRLVVFTVRNVGLQFAEIKDVCKNTGVSRRLQVR